MKEKMTKEKENRNNNKTSQIKLLEEGRKEAQKNEERKHKRQIIYK